MFRVCTATQMASSEPSYLLRPVSWLLIADEVISICSKYSSWKTSSLQIRTQVLAGSDRRITSSKMCWKLITCETWDRFAPSLLETEGARQHVVFSFTEFNYWWCSCLHLLIGILKRYYLTLGISAVFRALQLYENFEKAYYVCNTLWQYQVT